MSRLTAVDIAQASHLTKVPHSFASSISPAMAGAMLTTAFSGLPLVICGCLKIVYDLSLLFGFRHVKPPEEEAKSDTRK